MTPRYDWTAQEVLNLLQAPLVNLLWQAQSVHRQANPGYTV
ncbi:MAG: biotin synthase, partial [Synechococcus sp. SB0662_bin_45]|nr:biotin synthase [Synechococcus sp. SB0662_bin_45]